MSLCESLSLDQLGHLLAFGLERPSLLKLAGRLGTVPKGKRLDKLDSWELAWSLADFYHNDREVSRAVDKALEKDLGELLVEVLLDAPAGARALAWLLFESVDPTRDVAWALLRHGGEGGAEAAASVLSSVIADLDRAEAERAL